MTDIERVARAIVKYRISRDGHERSERLVELILIDAAENLGGEAAAAIAEYKAALSEAGLVIIPRPATMEMRDAGLKAWRSSRNKHEEQLLMDVHEAMIAAHDKETGSGNDLGAPMKKAPPDNREAIAAAIKARGVAKP